MAANRKMVIKPVRHAVPLDNQYADSTWVTLKSAIEAIFAKNASSLSYATLYRYVDSFGQRPPRSCLSTTRLCCPPLVFAFIHISLLF